jgi:hypothetical protein
MSNICLNNGEGKEEYRSQEKWGGGKVEMGNLLRGASVAAVWDLAL